MKFKTVKALERGLNVLKHISANPDGVSLKEVAYVAECSNPAALHLVQTMVECGFVKRLEEPVRYFLGDEALNLNSDNNHELFHQKLLAKMKVWQTYFKDASYHYCRLVGNQVCIETQVFNDEEAQEYINNPLGAYTSMGSLIHLAFWTEEECRQYKTYNSFEGQGMVLWDSEAALEKELDKIRNESFGQLPLKNSDRLRVGVPVFNNGQFYGSLTISWTPEKDLKDPFKILKQKALEIRKDISS